VPLLSESARDKDGAKPELAADAATLFASDACCCDGLVGEPPLVANLATRGEDPLALPVGAPDPAAPDAPPPAPAPAMSDVAAEGRPNKLSWRLRGELLLLVPPPPPAGGKKEVGVTLPLSRLRRCCM
jgi:hypothetical protein